MSFDPSLKIGEEIDNGQLKDVFKCGMQGGMRRSRKSGTLVLISSHIDSIYNDRWIGNTLHYTGMGLAGDQSLTFMQNKTLAESNTNGIEVHLFEVNRPQVYTYAGRVRLDAKPYQEDQPDNKGKTRKVWIFPLKLISGGIPVVSVENFEKLQTRRQRQARRLSDKEIRSRAEKARRRAGQRRVLDIRYERDQYIVENAKRRAKGKCDLCSSPAPFNGKDGDAYLETHHIIWLAKGGEDSISNTVALCPNCHRRMHVLDLAQDRAILIAAVSSHELVEKTGNSAIES